MITIGDKLKLTQDIWDDGEDHHPPGYIAKAGDIVIVRKAGTSGIFVSHEDITGISFRVMIDEFDVEEQLDGVLNPLFFTG